MTQPNRTIRFCPRAHDLRNLIVDMTTSYGEAAVGTALAGAHGSYDGKGFEHWNRTRQRRFKAILRLTRSLRELTETEA